MDYFDLFLFIGIILSGFLIGYPTGYAFGRRSVFCELGVAEKPVDVLEAEYLEVKH